MRLVAGTLAVLLAHSVALAEDAPPGGATKAAETKVAEAPAPAPTRQKVPLRVVRILSETNQALVYDRTGGGTYLLVTVGEKVGLYTVEAIDEDEVTLSGNGTQIVLAAPDRSWRRRNGNGEERAPRAVRSGEPAPADPYEAPATGGPTTGGPAPTDPYAEEVRQVRAPRAGEPADPYQAPATGAPGPSDPYAEEIREVRAPRPVDPAPAAPAAPPAGASDLRAPAPATTLPPVTPSPAVTPAPAAPAIAPPAGDPVLTRREVDAALANFGALTVAFRATFTPAGVRVDSILDGSLFSKAGLRAGDVIASVDGRPLRSLDDVAALYARAGSLRTVTAQVVRGGKTLTLRAVIQ